jgi:uncharacterized Zn-finger protein
MYSDIKPEHPFEIIDVATTHVHCDGGAGALGHPRIYLHIDPHAGFITCPYCSREFRYRAAS